MDRYASGSQTHEGWEYVDKVIGEGCQYLAKVTPPITKIALYSIAQFVMHLVAYGLLIGILGTGLSAAGGAFGHIDTIYRVLAGGGALGIFVGGGFLTKIIIPDLSRNLDLMIEEENEKLEELCSGETPTSVIVSEPVDSEAGGFDIFQK